MSNNFNYSLYNTIPNQFTYVNGLDEAKNYPLRPYQTMLLMDNDNPLFYLKMANQLGQTTLRVFKFEEIQPKQETLIDTNNFVNKQEFEELKTKIDTIYNKIMNKGVKEDESTISE